MNARSEEIIGELQRRISELNEIRARVVDERDDLKRRLINVQSHMKAYATSLDGLELHKLVIGGDTFDGARDARAIRRVVEHLLAKK